MKIRLFLAYVLIATTSAFGQQTLTPMKQLEQLQQQAQALRQQHSVRSVERNLVAPCRYDSTHSYTFESPFDSVLTYKSYNEYFGDELMIKKGFRLDTVTNTFYLTQIDSLSPLEEFPTVSYYSNTYVDVTGDQYIQAVRIYYRDETRVDSMFYFHNENNGLLKFKIKIIHSYDVDDRLESTLSYVVDESGNLYVNDKSEYIYSLGSYRPDTMKIYLLYDTLEHVSSIAYFYDGDNYVEQIQYNAVTGIPYYRTVTYTDTLTNISYGYNMDWDMIDNNFDDTTGVFVKGYSDDGNILFDDIFLISSGTVKSRTEYNYITNSSCLSFIDVFVDFLIGSGFTNKQRHYYFMQETSNTSATLVPPNNLIVTPNPSNGTLYVDAPVGERLVVTDLAGRQLWQGLSTGDATRIDLPVHFQGMVLLRAGKQVGKVVVQR
jgi:hypothetical protein